MRVSRCLGALSLALVLAPAFALSQEPDPRLRITVRAADTGRPLPGALVVVQGMGVRGTTDAAGVATISGLQSGARTVEVRYLGYRTETATVMVSPDRVVPVRFDLGVEPIQLAAVRVRARPSVLQTSGFLERRGSGFGTFITRDEIQRMQPRYMSDVLRRVAGVSITPSQFGGATRATIRGTKVIGNCPIQYYVDGTMTAFFEVDTIQPQDIEGLEIYRGAATVPPAYNKGTALCGVVLIWTRIQ